MPTIQPADRTKLDGKTNATLDQVKAKLGVVPNMFLTWAVNPVALDAYLQLANVAARGSLDAKQRELIAVAVGDANGCDYCLAAHGAIGRSVGLDDTQIGQARSARANDARDGAKLVLAKRIVESRGLVTPAEVAAFKAAGHTDADVLEVLVNVVLNIYTNYTNHIAGTEIDFPTAPAKQAA